MTTTRTKTLLSNETEPIEGIHRWRTNERYYTVCAQRDLFGAVVLQRQWGSLITKRHGSKREVVFSDADAIAALKRISATRTRHGYQKHC